MLCTLALFLALTPSGASAESWLDGTTDITAERFGRLTETAGKDPESKALMERALAKFGLRSLDELRAFVTVCGDDIPADRAGQTHRETTWQAIYPSEDEMLAAKSLAELYKDKIQAFRDKSRSYGTRAELLPDYAEVTLWVNPGICMRPDLKLIQAVETFAHELTHLLETDTLAAEDMLAYKDEEDYILKSVLARGGEADAFAAGYGAQIRVEGTREHLSGNIRGAFDEKGALLIPREKLAEIILAPKPDGFGYRDDHFHHRYIGKLRAAYTRELNDRNSRVNLANTRAKNAESMARNGEILKSNVGIRERNLLAVAAYGSDKEIAEAKSALAFEIKKHDEEVALAKVAIASHERLVEDVARRDERIKALKARVDAWFAKAAAEEDATARSGD